MWAWAHHETGDVAVLRLEELPAPSPGPGEVLVAQPGNRSEPRGLEGHPLGASGLGLAPYPRRRRRGRNRGRGIGSAAHPARRARGLSHRSAAVRVLCRGDRDSRQGGDPTAELAALRSRGGNSMPVAYGGSSHRQGQPLAWRPDPGRRRIGGGGRGAAAACAAAGLDHPCCLLCGTGGARDAARRSDCDRLSRSRLDRGLAYTRCREPTSCRFRHVSGAHAARLASLLTANGHLVCIQDRQEEAPLPAFTTTISLHEVGLNGLHAHGCNVQWAGWCRQVQE